MKRQYAVVACALAICGFGCAHQEEVHRPSAAEINAQIEKVKSDPQMPASAKAQVIGLLQGSLAKAKGGHPKG